MPTPKAAPEEAYSLETQSPETKSLTQWDAFTKAKLVPTQFECTGYFPIHRGEAALHCHTKFPFKAENVKRHVASCAGGFQFKVKTTDGKPSPFWAELQDAGLESYDFRCDVCDAQLRFHPSSILPHLKPHSGKTRRVFPGAIFNVTIGLAKVDRPEEMDDSIS